MENNYFVYHLHSEDSLLDSCTNYKLYVDKAVELGQKAIAFTEHGNIYNWFEKYMYCKEKGIKYIHGVECYLTESLDENVRDNYHTVLLAKNLDGFRELNILIDKSTQEDHFYYKPRLTFEEFFNISDNIIKISACLASPLSRYPHRFNAIYKDVAELEKQQEMERTEALADEINTLKNKAKRAEIHYERLLRKYDYYELQYHNVEDQIRYNRMLVNASKKYGKPLITGTDTHSLNKYKSECRSILQKAKKIEYSNEDDFDTTYKSYEELVDMFKKQDAIPMDVIMEAINNTNVVDNSIDELIFDTSVKYPVLCENEEEELKRRIVEKLQYKLDNGIVEPSDKHKYEDDIAEELRVFKKINMTGFMLFMSELVCWCWDNDIPIGFCRGSVGGSTIAYITDIIDVDPIKWNTVFSRFANEDREEVGDIDIDIAPSQRELVYKHIIDTFTIEKTAYILANGTISDKGTIDEIGRALDYLWLKSHPTMTKEDSPYKLSIIAQIKKEFDEDKETTRAKYKDVFYYFDGLVNTEVSQSIHPAGIVVSPITLADNYGTFWNDGKRIICLNMESVHECGLVKYDLLGLKNIEIINKTCKYIGTKYPKSHEINWNDEDVWNHICDSPVGIFQFESKFAYDSLKKYGCKCVNDLSLVNASIRPSGASYRDRLLNHEENHNPSQIIDDLLADNSGFLVFQEDTIKFLKDICGLSGSDADNVRRAIGRKQIDRLQKALPQILDGYCNMSPKPRDVSEEEAKTFLKIIEDSSNYQFGYNHSTGYSMIGYMCGYYRYYYPEEFISAYLNCSDTQEDTANGIELAKQMNIKIHNIKFRKSGAEYTVDKQNNAIYKGVSSIKFLNAVVAEQLYELRNEKFDSFIDLLKINPCNSKQTEILIKLDYFSEFGGSAKLLKIFDLYQTLTSKGKSFGRQLKKDKLPIDNEDLVRKYSESETDKMFKNVDITGLLNELFSMISDEDISINEKIRAEKEYLGYIDYINPKLSNRYVVVTGLDEKYSPRFKAYCLKNGQSCDMKVKKQKRGKDDGKVTYYYDRPFENGDILYMKTCGKEPAMKNVNGEWIKDETNMQWWIYEYDIVKMGNFHN